MKEEKRTKKLLNKYKKKNEREKWELIIDDAEKNKYSKEYKKYDKIRKKISDDIMDLSQKYNEEFNAKMSDKQIRKLMYRYKHDLNNYSSSKIAELNRTAVNGSIRQKHLDKKIYELLEEYGNQKRSPK